MMYRIPKGAHRSKPRNWRFWFGRTTWSWRCQFDRSAVYKPDLEDDTNKLVGIGFLPWHHRYSIRVGWRFAPGLDKISLYSYTYQQGKRDIKFMCYVPIGEIFRIKIEQDSKIRKIQITTNNESVTAQIEVKKKRFFSYLLRPFFGGDYTAQQEIKIMINET